MPGTSPGLTEVIGDYMQGGSALLEIELCGTDPLQYDRLLITGMATLSGTLEIQIGDNFIPSWGNTFDILTSSAMNGTFDTQSFPSLSDGLQWFVDYQTTGVRLLVSLAGDFDLDGDVDGNDFLIWQRGESPNPMSAFDLANWKAYFGTDISRTTVSTSVPEPAAWFMLMSGMMAIFFRRDAIVS